MSDDQSARGVSVYGSYRNTTPHMDRLAHQGMRLTQCFAVNATCGPSRAAILTGKYGHKNGFRRNSLRFDGTQTTFPKLLQKAGYQTALVGKWHLSERDAKDPPTGFDYWNIFPGQGDYYDPDMFDMGERKSHKGYATTILTEMGLEFLKKGDPDKPFLLMVYHKAPHSPWAYTAEHENLYDGKTMPEPPTLWDDYSTRSKATRMSRRSPLETIGARMQGDNWATGRLEAGGT
ncbi:MAG: sulfatase-like hydrolase/transferase, partial [Verrucomicrobia bacterium]|nr:sulfatase-like hydrolase/transferase [Verrucomicrobiota bacterium]